MTHNEQRLTAMIKALIEGSEQETLGYRELEKARKLVFEIETQDTAKQWRGTNLYDLDLTKLP